MKERLFKFLGLFILSASFIGGWVMIDARQFLDNPMTLPDEGMSYEVPAGSGVIRIARDLESRGVISNADYLIWYRRLTGGPQTVKAGRYQLTKGMTPKTFLDHLYRGDVIQYAMTFAEGATFAQVRSILDTIEEIDHQFRGRGDQEIMAALGHPDQHPEGLFFPDTYYFTAESSDLSIMRRAMQAMEVHLAQEWATRDSGLPYRQPYEALIMASIIEKETGRADERARIAGVFVRRLKRKMRLQTDPTVIYGLGSRFHDRLRSRDLRMDTPYNTYIHKGLPPTPIALPGIEAIRAALHPESGDSLYFVARGDGSHQFSSTLREHRRAVKKYQLGNRDS